MKNEPLKGKVEEIKAQFCKKCNNLVKYNEDEDKYWEDGYYCNICSYHLSDDEMYPIPNEQVGTKVVKRIIELDNLRSAVEGLKLCFVHNYSPHLERCQVCGKNTDIFFAKPIPNSIPPMQELPEMCLHCWIDKWLKCGDD